MCVAATHNPRHRVMQDIWKLEENKKFCCRLMYVNCLVGKGHDSALVPAFILKRKSFATV